MMLSKVYGPQFDPRDGTIGNLQLVIRWGLRTPENGLWSMRQGSYMKATKEEAEEWCANVKSCNRPDLVPANLAAAPYWCYPNHFDPLAPIVELSWNVTLDEVMKDQRFTICQMLEREIDDKKPKVILTISLVDEKIEKWKPANGEEEWATQNRAAIEKDLKELLGEVPV